MTDPFDVLQQVTDRESFLAFVRALAADREDEVKKEQVQPGSPYGPGVNGWENDTIERFLHAAVQWAEDSGRLPEQPSWRAFATFLYCGKGYE